MGQFTLNWDNVALLASSNSLLIRATHRRKDVGGAWSGTGYIPINDMPKSTVTALSPSLLDNVVYEFKVETICTTGGPTANINGIKEQIAFACIVPTITATDVASTATVNVAGTNISKVTFSMQRVSDNAIVGTYTIVVVAGGVATKTFTGLVASTDYYWTIELMAVVEGDELISSEGSYIGNTCGPYNITTAAPAICVAPEDLEVLFNEP